MDIDNTYSVTEDAEGVVLDDATITENAESIQTMDDGFVLDTEKVVVTVALFFITFIVLSPRGSLRHAWRIWRARRAKREAEQQQVVKLTHTPHNSMEDVTLDTVDATSSASLPENHDFVRSTSTLCTGMVLPPPPLEELSEEAKFAEMWPTVRMSKYRRLVLPPECKLVDKPKRVKKQEKNQSKEHKVENTEDNPAGRLVNYFRHFLVLMRSIYSYDYEGAARTVISWLQTWIRYRTYKPKPEDQEEDDDDDDASASVAAFSQRVGGSKDGAAVSPKRAPPVDRVKPRTPIHEEKKEVDADRSRNTSPKKRSSSFGSVYEVPVGDVGESDVGPHVEKLQTSALPQMPMLEGLSSDGAKRRQMSEPFRNGLPPLIERTLSSSAPATPPSTPKRDDTLYQSSEMFDGSGFSSPEKMPKKLSFRQDRLKSEDLSFFDAAISKAAIKQMSREVGLPDKNGYILGDEFLDPRDTPLLVFVNSRSGPQQGHVLITQLRRLLNPIQVWDLADGGPEDVLQSFSAMSKFRILVCGGDGTVSWILSALDEMGLERWPPIAILPLGTGNDLARIHGWGGGYANESLILILEQLSDSYISLLDRWEMSVINKKNQVKSVKSFTNYLGVGVDAQAALQVHMLRENKPQLFFSRAVNKAWYAVFGAEDYIKASCANLPHEITLVADGVEVPLPPDSQGIILLNIDSYAGGVPLWSQGVKSGIRANDRFKVNYTTNTEWEAVPRRSHSMSSLDDVYDRQPSSTLDRVDSIDDLNSLFTEDEKRSQVTSCDMPSSCQDGVIDIVSIRGAFHLGQIRVGLSNAERLCQCREATITIKKKVAVQIDGEPWRQNSCTLQVKRKKVPAYMLHRSPDESGGVETEMAKLLDWAEERGHIDRSVHNTLMKEFSRRIENKARQRRNRDQGNMVLTLKRAIASTSAPSFQTSMSYNQGSF